MKQALVGARIFTGEEFLDDYALVLAGEKIEVANGALLHIV